MRRLAPWLLTGCALFGCNALAQDSVQGVFVNANTSQEVIDKAIDAGVEKMNFIKRPIARSRLKKTNPLYQRIEIGNDGWRLPTGDPESTLLDLVEANHFGPKLVERLNNILTRQVRIGFELEQLPDAQNSVTLSTYRDSLGLPRPKINYSVTGYEWAGFAAAARLTSELFSRLRVDDKSRNRGTSTAGEWEGGKYEFEGAGHIMGTCRMGTDPTNSVTDTAGRVWGHDNLYIADGSVHPTNGGFNPVLTIMAMAFRTADGAARAL